MAYDIEDVIDIFMHHHRQGGDGKDGLFHKAARKIRKLQARFQITGMIQDIKARVVEQSQSRERYKIDGATSTPTVVEVDPRLPAMFEDAKRLVGIDGPREEIIKWLMEEGDIDYRKHLKVVSIVGFGGLSKTTLANQVYNKIKNQFEGTAFVSVSRTPHMTKILKDILYSVGYGGGTEMEDDVQKLIKILREQLINKRYLIVIDDLWGTKAWYTVKCAFVENGKGSRVITTTRIQDVATTCCSLGQGQVHQMQPLDENHSRRLFFKRLFDTDDSCPEEFRDISDNILRKCKGVPLAITSIASLLANQSKRVETWEKIHNSLGSELDTNPTLEWMLHVLNLSFNDLSHELKTCLMYLGMYPEDYKIRKSDLVQKWIAEGLIREKHGLELEEAAENCFHELINRSMIQPIFEYGTSEVDDCVVHDLMLDLIVLKCKEENFITIIDRKFTMNGASQVRRISHQFNDRDMSLAVERMSASVRSYMSFPATNCIPPLSKFELLRTLDMNQGNVQSESACLDLSAINHLFLLRYLRVSGFRLVLPKIFGKQKHLITIDIWFTELYPSNQSSDFTSLSSLRYLALPGTIPLSGGVALTNGLSKLCNLCYLYGLHIGANSAECIRELSELTNLRALNVIYPIPSDLEVNHDTILAASLDRLGNNNLRRLCMLDGDNGSGHRVPSTQFWSNCFTGPRHLQWLNLAGNLIPKVPNWMAHAYRLTTIYGLKIQELRSDGIRVLAQLPCLSYRGKHHYLSKHIPQPEAF